MALHGQAELVWVAGQPLDPLCPRAVSPRQRPHCGLTSAEGARLSPVRTGVSKTSAWGSPTGPGKAPEEQAQQTQHAGRILPFSLKHQMAGCFQRQLPRQVPAGPWSVAQGKWAAPERTTEDVWKPPCPESPDAGSVSARDFLLLTKMSFGESHRTTQQSWPES